jgi:hypothetical protein
MRLLIDPDMVMSMFGELEIFVAHHTANYSTAPSALCCLPDRAPLHDSLFIFQVESFTLSSDALNSEQILLTAVNFSSSLSAENLPKNPRENIPR